MAINTHTVHVNLAFATYDSSLHTDLINNVKDPLRKEGKKNFSLFLPSLPPSLISLMHSHTHAWSENDGLKNTRH